MTVLWVARGLPGSGKSTWAKTLPDTWRCSRDAIRAQYNDVWLYGNPVAEHLVTLIQDSMATLILEQGKDVVIDDTNLPMAYVTRWFALANMVHRPVEVRVKEFLHVPVEECIRRDAAREHPVGEEKILAMYRQYLAGE